MLRFKEDTRTIGILCLFAALSITGWVFDPGGWKTVALVVVTAIVSWLCAVIAHNTVHTPVFKNRKLNRAFQVWVSISYGFPVSEYVPGHNLSHHKFTQKREDVMRTTKVDTGWNLLNFLLFFVIVGSGVTVGNYRYKKLMKERLPAWNRQLLLEIVFVWGLKLAFLALDWRKALLYYIVPHGFAVWGITTVNYLQHDGCDEDHPYNHSRNFVGRLFNWVTLNNGFHGMHHMRPGLHWSLLRAEHEKVLGPHIDKRLEEPSLFLYMFRAFIWPGKRLRYDGQPVVIKGEGADHDWVAALGQKIPEEELGAVGTGII